MFGTKISVDKRTELIKEIITKFEFDNDYLSGKIWEYLIQFDNVSLIKQFFKKINSRLELVMMQHKTNRDLLQIVSDSGDIEFLKELEADKRFGDFEKWRRAHNGKSIFSSCKFDPNKYLQWSWCCYTQQGNLADMKRMLDFYNENEKSLEDLDFTILQQSTNRNILHIVLDSGDFPLFRVLRNIDKIKPMILNLKEYFIVRFQRKVDTIETTKFADFLLQNKVIESFQLFAYATKAENYSLMLHAIESYFFKQKEMGVIDTIVNSLKPVKQFDIETLARLKEILKRK